MSQANFLERINNAITAKRTELRAESILAAEESDKILKNYQKNYSVQITWTIYSGSRRRALGFSHFQTLLNIFLSV